MDETGPSGDTNREAVTLPKELTRLGREAIGEHLNEGKFLFIYSRVLDMYFPS